MIRILVLALSFLAAPAVAQAVFPALHDVAGVAADDVLNVRAEPAAGAEILGALEPDQAGVEVIALSEDGAWGRVNTGEQAGWAAMRYLARQPGQADADWSAAFAPRAFDCFGTEPFWRLALEPGGTLAYSALNDGDGSARPGGYEPVSASTRPDRRGFFGWLDSEPLGLTGILSNALCSDGMSDRDYGLAIDLILSDPDGDRIASGCCTLRP